MKRMLISCLCLAMLLLAGAGAWAEDIKYALSMYHFNIQYVCGGLEGFVPEFAPPWESWELNAAQTEDMIVVESFEPIVDLFLEHTDWSVTLEMQGYFLDVLAERHPGVLEKLKTLADAGGAELVSFHYSDQLFIGYPYEDWKRSVELTQATFDKYDIPLSKTVFCQEGQAGPGMMQAMEDYGYETMVWPKNLWIYQYGEFDADPYYTFGNLNMVAGAKGVNDTDNGVYMNWHFFGDGELKATNDWDPYFPWFFKYNPTVMQEYEDSLQALADDGYVIGSVADYAAALEDAEIEPSTPPDLLCGTWQPDSTDGTHKWMGGGGLWALQERDNFVRTSGAIAHRELLAAQTMAEAAQLELGDTLDEAWRLLALGQVTDASGINPFGGEIEYGIAHFAETLRIASDVIAQGKVELNLESAKIDTAAGTVEEQAPPAPPETKMDPPVAIEVNEAGRDVVEQWYRISDDPAIYKLELDISRKDRHAWRAVAIHFPGTDGPIEYSPALMDDQVLSFDRENFVFDHFYIPLANGLIGLGDSWYLVKDTAYCHLAAEIYSTIPDIRFRDETASPFETVRWVFYLIQGKEAALAFANDLNITPTLYR